MLFFFVEGIDSGRYVTKFVRVVVDGTSFSAISPHAGPALILHTRLGCGVTPGQAMSASCGAG
jgi:hypothetical protein